MSHKPTEEQQAVLDTAAQTDASLMIKAGAGCAKSTTLKMMGQVVKESTLGMAFNKSTAQAMINEMPSNFLWKTANGLGHGAWIRSNSQVMKWNLDERKLGKLVSSMAKERRSDLTSEQWDAARQLVSAAMLAGLTPDGIGRPLIEDSQEVWDSLADEIWIPRDEKDFMTEFARVVLIESINMARKGTISFDDQVYCSVCLGGKFTQYANVMVDEAQDLNALNHQMIAASLRSDGRIFAVGDPKQCHPPGTMIQLTGGESRSIENVNIGDQLVSYNRKVGFSGVKSQGRKVLDVKSFYFEGEMVRINTDGFFAHDCTPNHRCLVRWLDKRCFVVYLMQKGNQFRIGKAQSFYTTANRDGFGPAMRARQEDADALWILSAFDTKEEAEIEEKIIWTQFGLPDLIFKCSGKASSTQRHLDVAWDAIGDNSARAKLCLKKFKREFDFPIWKKGDSLHIGEKKFLTEACNLISEAMSVKVFDGSADCETWLKCRIENIPFKGVVYGLTVESNGFGQNLYLANGIVTHNSIYAFRGAHTESMEQIRAIRKNWADLPLMMTFRCPKVVVERQQAHAPGFRAHESNATGRFVQLPLRDDSYYKADSEKTWSWKDVQAELNGHRDLAILCRNNAPLMSMAFKLIRRRVGVKMLGRQLGKNLISFSKKVVPEDLTSAVNTAAMLTAWLDKERSLLIANDKEHEVEGLEDRVECLRAVLEDAEARDAGSMRRILGDLFAKEDGLVTLGSGHRSKGLEWDIVLHIDPWRLPSKQAKKAEASGDSGPMKQEKNLKYVVETRTKHTLAEANLEDFQ